MSRSLTEPSTETRLILATHRIARLERRPMLGGGDGILATTKLRVNATVSGNTTLVSGVGGQHIRVISAALMADTSVDVTFWDGTTIYAGAYHLPAMGGFVLPENISGWFRTNTSQPLILNLNAVTVVSGCLTYIVTTVS